MYRSPPQKGFTLIELLVVISIIGLLSSIVLASVNEARKKAADSAKTQLVLQYMTALQLAYDDLGTYPYVKDGGENVNDYCLGKGNKNGNCYATEGTENQAFNTLLNKYIPGPPVNNESITDGVDIDDRNDFRGIYYACNFDAGPDICSSYKLWWGLHDGNATTQKCLNAGTVYTNWTYSVCLFESN